MSWRADLMRQVIVCQWCGKPIGTNLYEVFDHISCTKLEAPAAPDASGPVGRLDGWQIEKRLNRYQRWADRHSGKGHLWA
jgi:hypothetical protein